MSGMVSKSRIPWVKRSQMNREVRMAVIELQNDLKKGPYPDTAKTRFLNNKGARSTDGPSPLPSPGKAIARYIEKDVGRAHLSDAKGGRGKWRLVAGLDKSGQRIQVLYLTFKHYGKTTFVRIK